MFVTFKYKRLNHLVVRWTLTIEAWLKLNIHFDNKYLENMKCMYFCLDFIALNVRDGIESKYPSITSLLRTISRWHILIIF